MKSPDFRIASDCALLVDFGPEISLDNHRRVVSLLDLLEKAADPAVVHVQPAYSSVLVRFDAGRSDHAAVEGRIRKLLGKERSAKPPKVKVKEIPVCYGGEFGPDLGAVAERARLSEEKTVAVHAGAEYRVYFLGFMPGFAYLGGLPPELATPRLSSPRRQVPAGSVGIAGPQTGVYPAATPGGWRLIGRTPLTMFDHARRPMSMLEVGDVVRFKPIAADEFAGMLAR